MENIIIREIRKEEYSILEDMLYEAIFQEEGVKPLPREIIKEPKINVFISNFGSKPDDYCLVAEIDNKIAGAVWTRILGGEIKGYGNIDNETPEFAISLYKKYRNKGYGSIMMRKMIELLRDKGYKQASLSVDKNNYAVKMYKKLGFEIIRENKHDYLMLLILKIVDI